MAHLHGRGQAAPDVDLRLPRSTKSVGTARHTLDSVLATRHVSDDSRQRIAIAVTEACTNAVKHAHGTDQYHLTARVDEHRCEVSVADHGCGFQPRLTHLVPRPIGSESGRGLHLVAALADQFELYAEPGQGTEVRLCVELVSGDAA